MPKLKPLVWRTEKRRVNDLLPYEKNPRKITDKQMEDLKESLKKFNLAELPAINTDGKVGLLYQQLVGAGASQQWVTKFETTTNGTSWSAWIAAWMFTSVNSYCCAR